jgi:hypothetical protein
MLGKIRLLGQVGLLILIGGVGALPRAAWAALPQSEDDEGVAPPPAAHLSARDVAGSGLFQPGLEPARADAIPGSALGVAGFDGARHTSTFSATADVALTGWLVLRGGVLYRPSERLTPGDERAGARPSVSLRGRLLQQGSAGVDMAVSAGYSQEKLSAEGGILHIGAAVGRSFDRLSLIANVAVGGDPEGDDRDGLFGGAVLYRLVPSLSLGAQGFFRRDLGSTDPRHLARADGQHDFAVGPVATYARDVLIFTVQTRLSGVRGNGTSALGAMALAGVGAVF